MSQVVPPLEEFLDNWDRQLSAEYSRIPLFDETVLRSLPLASKQMFARLFYHIRGHFYEFLWFVGSHAPDEIAKKPIIDNIQEEFGDRKSHEQLYLDFADSLGVDLRPEVVEHVNYESFALQFNRGHIAWLWDHDWDHQCSAFAAYERLDNIDYPVLLKMAQLMGIDPKGQAFFRVHCAVEHYGMVSDQLQEIYSRRPEAVCAGFDFICSHQLRMWNALSCRVLDCDLTSTSTSTSAKRSA